MNASSESGLWATVISRTGVDTVLICILIKSLFTTVISTDLVFVNGQPERHPEGAFYIEWYEGKKRFRKSVGKNATGADAQRHTKQAQLNAVNHGILIVPEKNKNGHSLAAAVAEYLDEINLTKRPKTHKSYSVALSCFLE